MLRVQECLQFRAGLPKQTFSLHNARRSCSAGTCSMWPSFLYDRHDLNLQREKEIERCQTHICRASNSQRSSNETFLSLEEAGLIELTNLDMHERFLCRLTVSSLNLLRVISKQEGVPIESLNAGILCDWFQKDKAKREKDFESATLKW